MVAAHYAVPLATWLPKSWCDFLLVSAVVDFLLQVGSMVRSSSHTGGSIDDTKCDLWSVGVILFLLLGGYLPFDDQDEDKVFERTRNGQFFFHPAYWKNITKQAKNLVTRLLTVNANKRLSASEALQHEWMLQKGGDHVATNIDTLKDNVAAGRVHIKATDAPNPNRVKDLQNNFTGYLERHKDESTARLTADGVAHKHAGRKFIEEGNTGKKFDDCYELGDVLGEGGYACVFRATHKKTKDVYAVKDVNTDVLEDNSLAALKEEIIVLKMLRGGPHIIRLYDVFEEPDIGHTYLVMEECKGGDLLTRITEKEVYTEREARMICKVIFEAMDYLHKMKICHRYDELFGLLFRSAPNVLSTNLQLCPSLP